MLLTNLGIHLVVGFSLSVIFQLAHVVETTKSVTKAQTAERERAAHMLDTTADFGIDHSLTDGYFGGLKFQLAHHVFQRICHLYLRDFSAMIARKLEEFMPQDSDDAESKKTYGEHFGVTYKSYGTMWQAFKAHMRLIWHLSKKDAGPLTA